jgi:hypothetical protein
VNDTHALEPLTDAVEEPEWDPVEERVLEPDAGAVMLADEAEAESVAEPEAVAEPDAAGRVTETPCMYMS